MPDPLTTGSVTFVAALVAVMLEHALTRARDRRDRIERVTLELQLALPIALTGLSTAVAPENSEEGDWRAARERALHLFAQLRVDAKGVGVRRAAAIRRAAEDAGARLAAAILRAMDGDQLTSREVLDVMTDDLQVAVFGERPSQEAAVDWYRAHGFAERAPRSLHK